MLTETNLHSFLWEGILLWAEEEERQDLGGSDIGDRQTRLRHRCQRWTFVATRRCWRHAAWCTRTLAETWVCRLELQETTCNAMWVIMQQLACQALRKTKLSAVAATACCNVYSNVVSVGQLTTSLAGPSWQYPIAWKPYTIMLKYLKI